VSIRHRPLPKNLGEWQLSITANAHSRPKAEVARLPKETLNV